MNPGEKGDNQCQLISITESQDKNIDLEDREEERAISDDESEGTIEIGTIHLLLSSIQTTKDQDGSGSGRHDHEIKTCSRQDQQGHISPTPWESSDGSIKRGEINSTATCIPRDTPTLAKLYQSSRRSRHISPDADASMKSLLISPTVIRSPPLISSTSLDGQRICHQVHDILDLSNEDWSTSIASPVPNHGSSSSVSLFEGIMTNEAVSASEVFDDEDIVEREQKRRKTFPDEGYFFNIVSSD